MSTAKPTIKIYPDGDAFYRAAAEQITAILQQTLRAKGIAAFVFTGGTTPKPVYELLGTRPYVEQIDWNRIHYFWGDERCVPPDDPESNFGTAWNSLLSRLNVPSSHLHRIRGEMEDPDKAAFLYESEILNVLPGSPVPSFDLVLLGMGRDGHTASLFPGTRWDEQRLVIVNHAPATAAARVSMTPRLLNESGVVVFLVSGNTKSRTVAEIFKNPSSGLPASRIGPVRGNLIWILDDSAACLIRDLKFQ